MEKFTSIEIATVVVLAVMVGSFLRNIADSLFNRWTKDYVEREEFEGFKKQVGENYLHKDHYNENLKRVVDDIEELKKITIIIAIKMGVNLSEIHMNIPAESLKEAIQHAKTKN
jgi:hypothetical protein